MENFFCGLSALEEMKISILKKFRDEKIFFSSSNEKLKLELLKNHILEQNTEKITSESVKCLVLDYSQNLLSQNEIWGLKKPIYLIFNSVEELLNFKGELKHVRVVLCPNSALSFFHETKKSVLNFCQKTLFSISNLFFQNLANFRQISSYKQEFEAVIKCILFFQREREINLYNYFEFSNLIKKLAKVKSSISEAFFEKISSAFVLTSGKKIDESVLSFLLIWLENEFLRSKNLFMLKPNSFCERYKVYSQNYEKVFALKNSFNFKSTNLVSKIIKENYAEISAIFSKIFNLSYIIMRLFKAGKHDNFSAHEFLRAISFAADMEEDMSVFQLMKNLGYLNAA